MDKQRLISAAIVAVLFVSLSWAVPMMYYTVAPSDHVMSVESTDVAVGNETINVTVRHYSADSWPVEAKITLYQEPTNQTNGTATAIETWAVDGFVDSGENTGSFGLDPSTNISSGAYTLRFEIDVHTRYYVVREITYETDPFIVNGTVQASM